MCALRLETVIYIFDLHKIMRYGISIEMRLYSFIPRFRALDAVLLCVLQEILVEVTVFPVCPCAPKDMPQMNENIQSLFLPQHLMCARRSVLRGIFYLLHNMYHFFVVVFFISEEIHF